MILIHKLSLNELFFALINIYAAGAKYKVAYSLSKSELKKVKNGSFKKMKNTTVKSSSKNAITLKKLKSGKKYYVKVCAYKVVNGKTVIGNWSSVKTVKIK